MFTKTQATKVQAEDQRTADLINNLNGLLRATASNYTNSDNFYVEYTAFLSELSGTFQSLRNYADNNANSFAQTEEQAKARSQEFAKNIEEVNGVIDTRRREISEIQGKIQQIVTTNFTSKNFGKLKVKPGDALNDLFTNFHQTYYPEQQSVFDWATFKKTEVEKNKLADFNRRLLEADYNRIPSERVDALDFLRNNEQLLALASKKDGATVQGFIDYLGLVKGLAAAQRDLAQQQTRVEALRLESDAYNKDVAVQRDIAHKRREHLEALNRRMIDSAAPFGNVDQRASEMRQATDEHKRYLRNIIHEVQDQVSIIPEAVYIA